jgi:ATP-dependent protease HslVU (ClpYQ) peptidase subunit
MSVVVAIKSNNKIYMGADSQITRGGTRRSLSNQSNFKIWRIKETKHTLMGAVGLVREMNVAKMGKYIGELEQIKDTVDFEYMVLEFIPRLFKTVEFHKLLTKDLDDIPRMNCSYLVAYKNQLYQISPDGATVEIDDFAAIGSGSNEAMGSLLSTMNLDPVERITIAIKASAANDIYVDYPIVISNTENEIFEIIYENETIKKEK